MTITCHGSWSYRVRASHTAIDTMSSLNLPRSQIVAGDLAPSSRVIDCRWIQMQSVHPRCIYVVVQAIMDLKTMWMMIHGRVGRVATYAACEGSRCRGARSWLETGRELYPIAGRLDRRKPSVAIHYGVRTCDQLSVDGWRPIG